jgi:hypothetical protein
VPNENVDFRVHGRYTLVTREKSHLLQYKHHGTWTQSFLNHTGRCQFDRDLAEPSVEAEHGTEYVGLHCTDVFTLLYNPSYVMTTQAVRC